MLYTVRETVSLNEMVLLVCHNRYFVGEISWNPGTVNPVLSGHSKINKT